MTAFMHRSLGHFFALSIALHVLAFLAINPHPVSRVVETESIAVSLLPQAETITPLTEPTPSPAPVAKDRPARRTVKSPPVRTKKPPVLAPKDTLIGRRSRAFEKELPAPMPEPLAKLDTKREEPPAPKPLPENTIVVERSLPTLKDLLPPASWTSPTASQGTSVSLDTRDPIYVSYFTRIKQNIEQQWEYPEVALRYGLQGRLMLEFTIGGNGQLENLRMIRSSGSQVLDQEALRAIKAAAPFPPIPTWIKSVPLSISASMEYHDNRVNYRSTR